MPIYEPGTWLGPDGRGESAGTITAGRFAIPLEGGRFDRHHHDDDELWFVTAGKGLLLVDGEKRYAQAGDIVLHPAGTDHDILAVYEPLAGFFTETGHPAGGRPGHLHRDEAQAAGHDVPALPVPADFPPR
jgi:mannose-6-phosphate isomerase-like protein (cupin superfamily)